MFGRKKLEERVAKLERMLERSLKENSRLQSEINAERKEHIVEIRTRRKQIEYHVERAKREEMLKLAELYFNRKHPDKLHNVEFAIQSHAGHLITPESDPDDTDQGD
jgi:hypothetical protein